jgi:hypothetical protein
MSENAQETVAPVVETQKPDLFDLPASVKSDPKALREIMEAKHDDVQAIVDKYVNPAPVAPTDTAPDAAPQTVIPEIVPVPAPVPVSPENEYKFIFTTDSGITLRFRTQEKVNKHIASQQKVIERFNGERSQFGSIKQKNEELERQIAALTTQVQKFAQSAPAPESIQNAPYQGNEDAIMRRFNEEISTLKNEVSSFKQATQAEKDKAIWDAKFQGTVAEVGQITDQYPALKTGIPFDKINEIVLNRPEEFQALVPPEDQERFKKTLEVLSYRYMTDDRGMLDITHAKLSTKAAIAAWRAESGEDALASATVQRNSATSTVEAITRAANKSPTLPPTAPAQPSTAAVSSIDEAQRILQAASQNRQAYSRNPELSRKVREATMFINSLPKG